MRAPRQLTGHTSLARVWYARSMNGEKQATVNSDAGTARNDSDSSWENQQGTRTARAGHGSDSALEGGNHRLGKVRQTA